MKASVLGGLLGAFCTNIAFGCDISWGTGPRPSWYEMVGRADIIFVGRVVDTSPETALGLGQAEFEVETWVRGGSGSYFTAAQGSGSNCVAEFWPGSRVIFLGHWRQYASSDAPIAIAGDTGWDGVVYLGAPPTPDEQAKLHYLDSLRR